MVIIFIDCVFFLHRDYRSIPLLDKYEDANLDSEDYDTMSPGTRMVVERQLRKRDRQQALASGRTRPGLLYDGSEDEDDEGEDLSRARRRRIGREAHMDQGMEFEEVREGCVAMIYLWFVCGNSLGDGG